MYCFYQCPELFFFCLGSYHFKYIYVQLLFWPDSTFQSMLSWKCVFISHRGCWITSSIKLSPCWALYTPLIYTLVLYLWNSCTQIPYCAYLNLPISPNQFGSFDLRLSSSFWSLAGYTFWGNSHFRLFVKCWVCAVWTVTDGLF